MPAHASSATLLLIALIVPFASPARAVDGQVLITQKKALSGKVTPGDAAGFPVTISRAGSYVLGSNLVVPAGRPGILVKSPDVTIDLNGFQMSGNNKADFGIRSNHNNLTVRNGTITKFKFDGITGTGDYWIIDNMRIVSNLRDGIACDLYCQISGSIISSNGREGIRTTTGTVIGNTILDNNGYGLYAFGWTGYGNNTFQGNKSGQAGGGAISLHPNACNGVCP